MFEFKVDLKLSKDMKCSITSDSNEADMLRQAKLWIWDETSMAHKYIVKCTIITNFTDSLF